jgi:WD40 repeat protein
MATRFSTFNNDFEKTEELVIDGLMPRLSPNKKHIAYVAGDPTMLRLALIDHSGSHPTYPPFLLEKHVRGWVITSLEWSPNSQQLVIAASGPRFSSEGHPIRLLVYDLESSSYESCYQSTTPHSEGAYFMLSVKWFPDNRKLVVQDNLAQGKEKVAIVDTISGDERIVYQGPTLFAAPIRNGNDILIVATEKRRKLSFEPAGKEEICDINTYNIQSRKLTTISKLSYSTYYKNRLPIFMKPSTILMVSGGPHKNLWTLFDIDSHNTETVAVDQGRLYPQAVSPLNQRLICGQTESGYGIFDIESQTFKPLDSFAANSPIGEDTWGPMLFFNRIEWIQ